MADPTAPLHLLLRSQAISQHVAAAQERSASSARLDGMGLQHGREVCTLAGMASSVSSGLVGVPSQHCNINLLEFCVLIILFQCRHGALSLKLLAGRAVHEQAVIELIMIESRMVPPAEQQHAQQADGELQQPQAGFFSPQACRFLHDFHR